MIKNNWFVYIIKAVNGKLYTGITTDIERRWKEHLGQANGAKFFRISRPKEVVFVGTANDRSEASKLEAKIKKLKKEEKLNLIESRENLVAQYIF